ncbi:MAG: bifunctional lysylphosphatidylglycerol flippase/synthetase MprF [Pseudomonadota bacterium]
MTKRWRKYLLPLLGIFLFAVAAVVLYRELRGESLHGILMHIAQMPRMQTGLAVLITFLSYMVMTGYDLIALRYVGHRLAYGRIALASGIGYAFSNTIGFSMLAGASVRYRIYSAWGLSAAQITRMVVFCSLSLWLGFFALSGAVFVIDPLPLPDQWHLPFTDTRVPGFVLVLAAAAYIGLIALPTKSVTIRNWEFQLPSLPLATGQMIIAVSDWLLASLVLFALMPAPRTVSFEHFIGVFLLAQLAGLISQVPGGLGVFESLFILLMPAEVPRPVLLGALVVYRGIYYLLPLMVATLSLGVMELMRHRSALAHAGSLAGAVLSRLFIPLTSGAVFVAGTILLFSGALPAVSTRMTWLARAMPLPLLEISHFIGSLAGMGLMLLARGLQLRLDAAWVLTLGLIGFGTVASLLKGLDYEEALILTLIGLSLLPGRRLFFRKASLFSESLTTGWFVTIAIVIGASIWLGLFAFRHVEYARELWWHFSFKGQAPRFMRATVGAMVLALMFGLSRLLRPAAPRAEQFPGFIPDGLAAIIQQSPNAQAHLALLGDKRFLLNEARNAFVMYAVTGQTWVAMGDPVGPEREWPELIWQFLKAADRFGDHAVFYEVGHEHLHLYLDAGFSLLKLGEEARVPLTGFSLEGSDQKNLRYIHRKLVKQGCRFEIFPPEDLATELSTLKAISDHWLKEKKVREKGFSLGFFDPAYLQRLPVAVVRIDDRIVAFANIWQGGEREELTIDLMRYAPESPRGVMEFLFIELMLWGAGEGYRWFNLGMAPMTGMETNEAAPLWHKIGGMVARFGEHFYNFKGLRQYKEKFNPVWRPKYLACPGGLALPRMLTDIGALVSGGIKGIFFK